MPAIEPGLSRRILLVGGLADVILAISPTQSQIGSPMMETAIRVDSAVTTLVNIFTLNPENQPQVLALLREGTESLFSRMPGWISTNLLQSRDGKQVVIYSQWRDAEAIGAFRRDPRMQAYFQRFGELAKHEAFTCDVSYSLHA